MQRWVGRHQDDGRPVQRRPGPDPQGVGIVGARGDVHDIDALSRRVATSDGRIALDHPDGGEQQNQSGHPGDITLADAELDGGQVPLLIGVIRQGMESVIRGQGSGRCPGSSVPSRRATTRQTPDGLPRQVDAQHPVKIEVGHVYPSR